VGHHLTAVSSARSGGVCAGSTRRGGSGARGHTAAISAGTRICGRSYSTRSIVMLHSLLEEVTQVRVLRDDVLLDRLGVLGGDSALQLGDAAELIDHRS
jgi:hypothetical protein